METTVPLSESSDEQETGTRRNWATLGLLVLFPTLVVFVVVPAYVIILTMAITRML